MTFLSLMLMCAWLAMGFVVAWLFGRISDIGDPKQVDETSKKPTCDMPREINTSKIT
jgi:hypothetical protein